ncbi:hypothetical protein PLICRDRAFT_697750 [Plicaturopsis crispa FD-325 SS-3]|nr:hypothetical protein PLICRDRAFT_697750 [Plicaturopsis crispa FD-325 SS-3]
MKSFAAAIALVALIPHVLGLTINTPVNVVECQPLQFTWTGGTGPYFLSLVPGGQSMAAAIKQFPEQQGTSYTWNVDLPQNTQFNIALKDSTGATAYSDVATVLAGSTSCENTAVTEGASGAASGSATATSAGSSSTGSSKASGSTTASSSASSSSSSSNGASRSSVGAFGVAGLMGLVGAALF